MIRSYEECRKMLVKLAIKHRVTPKLICERLLSKQDWDDMLAGITTYETLAAHVALWREEEMWNYSDGTRSPYSHFDKWR
jgi:hypothetical protein